MKHYFLVFVLLISSALCAQNNNEGPVVRPTIAVSFGDNIVCHNTRTGVSCWGLAPSISVMTGLSIRHAKTTFVPILGLMRDKLDVSYAAIQIEKKYITGFLMLEFWFDINEKWLWGIDVGAGFSRLTEWQSVDSEKSSPVAAKTSSGHTIAGELDEMMSDIVTPLGIGITLGYRINNNLNAKMSLCMATSIDQYGGSWAFFQPRESTLSLALAIQYVFL